MNKTFQTEDSLSSSVYIIIAYHSLKYVVELVGIGIIIAIFSSSLEIVETVHFV